MATNQTEYSTANFMFWKRILPHRGIVFIEKIINKVFRLRRSRVKTGHNINQSIQKENVLHKALPIFLKIRDILL